MGSFMQKQFLALDFKNLYVYGGRVEDEVIYVFLVETSEVQLLTLYLIGICLILPQPIAPESTFSDKFIIISRPSTDPTRK